MGDRNLTVNPLDPATENPFTSWAAVAVQLGLPPVSDLAHDIRLPIALSGETETLTAGTSVFTFRMPCAMIVTSVRASLNTASSAGNVIVDINKNGVSIFSTRVTVDQGSKTSIGSVVTPVLSTTSLADDDEITFDLDTVGVGATGVKVTLIGVRP